MLHRALRRKRLLLGLLLLAVALWAHNSSWLVGAPGKPPLLLAHRGLAQTFPIADLSGDEDTSKIIYPPEHPFLENTLASMEAAFQYGAGIVELDVQLTRDGKLAVFHDATLEYRTNGSGSVREHILAELKALDIGYGYTADGGRTFPFRGKGVGLMPSLDEVFAHFPDHEFLLDIKSGTEEDSAALAALLARLPESRRKKLAAYGSKRSTDALARALPDLRLMSRASLKQAALEYLAIGWTGYVPQSCRNTEFRIPLRFAPLLWGWPHRFVARLDSVNTRVVLVNGNGRWSEGFDSEESLRAVPEGFAGVLWTNRIDRIGHLFKP